MVIENDHNVGGPDDGLAGNTHKTPSPELTL
jgi:hypothetical protein